MRVATPFWERVLVDEWSPGACWEWTGSVNCSGYGTAKRGGRSTSAHRIAYLLAFGVEPGDSVVRHRCDNRLCCRPDHLELGTVGENRRDSMERGHWVAKRCGGRVPDGDVVDIRWRRWSGQSPARIAEELGYAVRTVQRIYGGVSHKHLPGPVTLNNLRTGRVSGGAS